MNVWHKSEKQKITLLEWFLWEREHVWVLCVCTLSRLSALGLVHWPASKTNRLEWGEVGKYNRKQSADEARLKKPWSICCLPPSLETLVWRGRLQRWEQAPEHVCVMISTPSIWAVSHSMHTRARVRTSHALQIWANWLRSSSSSRAGFGGSVPACSLCEGQGASLHSWNVFRLCLDQKGWEIRVKGARIEQGKFRHAYNWVAQGGCIRTAAH